MKHLDSIYWVVMFTDIKNYTLKTSLLTKLQIVDFLSKQDEIVIPIINKFFWKIIKTIWDSYMVIFEKAENWIMAAIEIQKELEVYNSNIKLNLNKIELRISLDYWIIEREINNKNIDVFWNTVNIASRLQSVTKENEILTTKQLINQLKDNKNNIKYINLWKNSFKWILYEIDIYKILINEELTENNLSNNYFKTIKNIETSKEIKKVIFNFSSVSALIWLQPIPFIDNYSLVAIHVYMLIEIAKKYNIKLSLEESKEVLSTIISSVWISYAINNWAIVATKISTFWVWSYLTIPLNFWFTYWLGNILNLYFYKKSKWVKASNQELKDLFKDSYKEWKKIAKTKKDIIIENWNKYKKITQDKIRKLYKKNKK